MTDGKVDLFTMDSSGKRVLPSFSIAERDRRYGRVRELMVERGLDCLLVPFSEVGETQANSRYLCQIGGVQGGAWVVFPATGEVTAFVWSMPVAFNSVLSIRSPSCNYLHAILQKSQQALILLIFRRGHKISVRINALVRLEYQHIGTRR